MFYIQPERIRQVRGRESEGETELEENWPTVRGCIGKRSITNVSCVLQWQYPGYAQRIRTDQTREWGGLGGILVCWGCHKNYRLMGGLNKESSLLPVRKQEVLGQGDSRDPFQACLSLPYRWLSFLCVFLCHVLDWIVPLLSNLSLRSEAPIWL